MGFATFVLLAVGWLKFYFDGFWVVFAIVWVKPKRNNEEEQEKYQRWCVSLIDLVGFGPGKLKKNQVWDSELRTLMPLWLFCLVYLCVLYIRIFFVLRFYIYPLLKNSQLSLSKKKSQLLTIFKYFALYIASQTAIGSRHGTISNKRVIWCKVHI